jgi:hypothetical protein
MESTIRPEAEAREAVRGVAKLWWLWLLIGVAWIVAGLVILQFDRASVTTVGVIVGIMFWGVSVPRRGVLDHPGVRNSGGQRALVVRADRRVPDGHPRLLDRRQFFFEKAYVLPVFAGIWALMQGFTDIIGAFQIRKLRELV